MEAHILTWSTMLWCLGRSLVGCKSQDLGRSDKEFLNNLEDYGTFVVFHIFDNGSCSGVKIINRCYVGFSKDNGIPSFMHGNLYGSYWNPQIDKIMSDIILIFQI